MSEDKKDESEKNKQKEESGFQVLPLLLFLGPFVGLIIYKLFFDQ